MKLNFFNWIPIVGPMRILVSARRRRWVADCAPIEWISWHLVWYVIGLAAWISFMLLLAAGQIPL